MYPAFFFLTSYSFKSVLRVFKEYIFEIRLSVCLKIHTFHDFNGSRIFRSVNIPYVNLTSAFLIDIWYVLIPCCTSNIAVLHIVG